MACKTSYSWSHNFPRLATNSGFSFSSHRPRIVLDWNKIKSLDIDSLIKERNFRLVEQHVNDVTECSLESEFDVRILDAGVVKLFRLAQLTVEYQQFCRQYLDRSVVVLRDELAAAMQELERIRKEIRSKDEEIRKLRRKTKSAAHRVTLPYGNDNIAAMILRTLSNRGEILPGPSVGEAVPMYNKCPYCEKVFLNQLYLQSHIMRRHPDNNETDTAPKDKPERLSPENSREMYEVELSHLRNEVKALRDKLNNEHNTKDFTNEIKVVNDEINAANENNETAEKTNETTMIEKFEEWKSKENEKYLTEMNELRQQLTEHMNLLKANAAPASQDGERVKHLQSKVHEQETQIEELKALLLKENSFTKVKTDIQSELEKKDETWRSKIELVEKQHEEKLDKLLKTLETVYKEVKAARESAEAERTKVSKLETLLLEKDKIINELQYKFIEKENVTAKTNNQHKFSRNNSETKMAEAGHKQKLSRTVDKTPNKRALDELHRRAQELLSQNIDTDTDATDTQDDISDSSVKVKHKLKREPSISTFGQKIGKKTKSESSKIRKNKKRKEHRETMESDKIITSSPEYKVRNNKIQNDESKRRSESESGVDLDEDVNVTPSPTKVIRAKLAEEVNNRLLELGVEPLKSGVPSETYQRRNTVLQKKAQAKTKKDPTYGKMRNRIITYLDSKTSKEAETIPTTEDVSPSKEQKSFKVSSIFSTVKHKAMAFIKTSDKSAKAERNTNESFAKKAAQLLRTPPDSPISSANPRRASIESRSLFSERVKQTITRMTSKDTPKKTSSAKSQSVEVLYNADSKSRSESENSDLSSSLEDAFSGNKRTARQVVTSAIAHVPSKSIENLIKSPIRKPNIDKSPANNMTSKFEPNKQLVLNSLVRPASATPTLSNSKMYDIGSDSDDDSALNVPENNSRKYLSEENLLTRSSPTSTKGVLKNAPSTSSLSKKKVIFDLEANQMKSVSASPSQSVTEGNDINEAAMASNTNEWDISSIEEELVKETKTEETLKLESRRSPKIAELTQRIQSQLARRPETIKKPTGAIEVMSHNPSPSNLMDGSNTSVGSSMLDDSNEFDNRNSPGRSRTPIPAPRFATKLRDKDASDLDVSDWSIDDILKGK